MSNPVMAALLLLAAQGLLGAFDTVYYHEYRARLPAIGKRAMPELRLHAGRDFIYGVVFGTLPWLSWRGAWAAVLAVLLATEIAITLADFVVEDTVRKSLGGVFSGERVTHAIMGIVYGAMLANLVPLLIQWAPGPTALMAFESGAPIWLKWLLTLMAVGVSVSGIRDAYAALGGAGSQWPWPVTQAMPDE